MCRPGGQIVPIKQRTQIVHLYLKSVYSNSVDTKSSGMHPVRREISDHERPGACQDPFRGKAEVRP